LCKKQKKKNNNLTNEIKPSESKIAIDIVFFFSCFFFFFSSLKLKKSKQKDKKHYRNWAFVKGFFVNFFFRKKTKQTKTSSPEMQCFCLFIVGHWKIKKRLLEGKLLSFLQFYCTQKDLDL
jgi:hypothetical protein